MQEFESPRVCLLEDNSTHATWIANCIQDKGFNCTRFPSALVFQQNFEPSSYDVVLVERDLESGSSGLYILDWIRNSLNSSIPVVFISSSQEESDIVSALEAGADGYMVKPVKQNELAARLHRLVQRNGRENADLLSCEPYTFDTSTRQLHMNNESIDLTEKEYDLAHFLFLNRGRTVSRRRLLNSVWGITADLNTRTVDTHASRIRKKLKLQEQDGWKLNSIYQHGYRLQELSTSSSTSQYSPS